MQQMASDHVVTARIDAVPVINLDSTEIGEIVQVVTLATNFLRSESFPAVQVWSMASPPSTKHVELEEDIKAALAALERPQEETFHVVCSHENEKLGIVTFTLTRTAKK